MTLHLQRDLEALKNQLLSMGRLVEKVSNQAIAALQERNPELAAGVHELDKMVDQQEVQIEEECLKMP